MNVCVLNVMKTLTCGSLCSKAASIMKLCVDLHHLAMFGFGSQTYRTASSNLPESPISDKQAAVLLSLKFCENICRQTYREHIDAGFLQGAFKSVCEFKEAKAII